MALVYLDGVGYVDDGGDSGGGGSYDQSQQSPYAYNQTYDNNQSVQSPYAYNEQQDNQQPSNLYVPDQTPSFDYNPETPFNPNDYQSYSQPQQDFSSWFTPQQPNYSDYYSQEATAQYPSNLSVPDQFPSFDYNPETTFNPNDYSQPQQDPLSFNNPPLFMGTSANQKLTLVSRDNTPGAAFDYNPETPFDYTDYNKPYVPYWQQEVTKPPLPYQEGYDPQVGSQLDPSKLFEYASPETMKNLDPFNMALNTLGAAVSPLGAGVKLAADSNIPVVSDVAGGVRNAWEQVVEPAGGFFTSTAGSLSKDGNMLDFLHGSSPIGSVIGGAVDVLQGRDPTQYYKDAIARGPTAQLAYMATNPGAVDQANAYRQQLIEQFYQNQLAQGKTPQEAQREAGLYGVKIANPFTVAEMPGQEGFSKLPAPAQLALMGLDPVGNPVYNTVFKPLTHGLPTAIGKAADATGLTDVAKALDEKLLQAPIQKDYKAGLEAENVFNVFNDIADEFQLPAPDLARTFLKDTESPLYYGNLPAIRNDPKKLAVAQKWEQLYDASSTPELTSGKPVLEGGKPLPQDEGQLGVMAQDTTGAVDPNAGIAKKPIEFPPAEAGTVGPKQAALDAQNQADFNSIKSASPVAEAKPLPDNYAGIKLPNKEAAGLDEWFGAVRTAQGVDTGALKLDKTLAKPGYREAKPLEEWGIIGKALRGANTFTQATVARPFLNTFSRGAIRDPLSNEGKLLVTRPGLIAEQVKGLFGKSQVNAQAEKLYGKGLTLGPSSITEGSGTRSGKSNPVAELYYVAANPINEISAKGLKLATGGKFQDWSTHAERREANVKELLFNKLRLEIGDRLTKEAVQNEFFKSNPELYKLFTEGKIDTGALEKALSGKHFDGFDLNDAKNKTYNPANTSKEFDEKWDKVLSGQAGIYGNIVYKAGSSLVERVKAENQRKITQYLKDAGYRVPANGDLSKIKPSVLRDAKANAKLIKLEEIVPGHPLYEQMVGEAIDALDAARLSMFPNDPRLYQASEYLTNAALNYAKDSGRYDMFTKGFNDRVAAKEAEYAVKFKAPPTDFQKMMTLKDKYESGEKMPPQQKKEYEAWRDKQPIRNMASEAGVEQPQNTSVFNGAKTLEDYQKTIKQTENFKSREYDEFGGTPLTVAHQKQLAQALFDKDYTAFQKLLSDIRSDRRYIEGITGEGKGKGTGIYVDKSKANTDRTINRLQEYWKDANAVDTGSPGLPKVSSIDAQYDALPSLKPDYVRVVHQTSSGNIGPISKTGLRYTTPDATGTPYGDAATAKAQGGGWLKTQEARHLYGDSQAIFDMPNDVWKMHYKGQASDEVLPSQYFVGSIDGKSEPAIYKSLQDMRTGKKSGLPQPTPPQPKADYTDLYTQINNPPPVRLNVGKQKGHAVNGAVLSYDTMRKIASNFTRKERVNSKGDTYVAPVSRVQMNKYLHDFQATDQYYRKITNNQFKLDPDYLVPVRISDGVTLNELMGQPIPPRIGPEVPSLKGVPFEYLGETLKQRYGEDVYKQDFDKMDPALRDSIIQDIGREYFGVDPLNPLVNPKGNAEHASAIQMLYEFGEDAQKRLDDTAATKAGLTDRQDKYNLDMKKTVETLAAERANIALQVNDEAYKGTKGVLFDYRDKNRLDQALGSILPFQYWARQNFAYLARHFSANPYHFAAVLNFYQEMEQENSDPSIPGYQKSSIFIAKMPGGENLTLPISSYLPINPFNSDDAFGGLAIMSDDDLAAANTKLANKEPLAILFGSDKKNAQGKITGRDKGLVPSWLSVNPFIKDHLLQSGVANKWWQNLTGDKQTLVGQDYPEETRAAHASVSWFPGARLYPTVAAATPIAGAMRNAGMTKGEFNPVQPINEMLYGRNAGKPATAIKQEIVRMTKNGEITEEEGKLAIAAFNDGSYNSVPLLAAIDRTYADNFALKIASQVGFSGMLSNTPRQQVANQLYAEQDKAYAQPPTVELDYKGTPVVKNNAVSKFYKDNPAAGVLSSTQASDTAESIRQSVADDKAFKAIDKLKAQRNDGSIDYRTYASEMDKLQGANPEFFKKYPYYSDTPTQQKYYGKTDEYNAIGGEYYDRMKEAAQEAKNAGDEEAYKKIVTKPEYKEATTQRLAFAQQNPDWYKQYTRSIQERNNAPQATVPGNDFPQLIPGGKATAPKTQEDLQYTKTTNDYYDIGGDKFDKLQTQAYAAKDNGDDATYKKIVSSPEYQKAQDKRNEFIFDNPDWYKTYSDNTIAHGGTNKNQGPLPPTADKAIPRLTPKPPKSIDDIKYAQTESEYYAKGGDEFDRMQADIKKYFDANQDNKAYDIINSRDYQQVKATQNQFKKDNPDFAKRYDAEYTAKYGKPPKNEAEQIYDEQRAAYYKIGGADFDQTQKKIDDLFKAGKDAEAYTLMNDPNYKRVTATQDQYKIDNPDFAKRYNADNFAKYGTTPKSLVDKQYAELKGQYANIGGAKYDALSALINDYKAAGDKKSEATILNSAAYKQAKAARQQFLDDNPEFAARYKAENEAKYGPSKPTSSSSGSSSSGSTSYSTGSSSRSSGSAGRYTPKKTTTSYARSTSSSKGRNGVNFGGNFGGNFIPSNSPQDNTPFTNAQKAAYAYARNTLGYSSTQAAGYARKVPATQKSYYAPGSSSSNTTKSVAALPKPTSSSVKVTKTPVDSTKNGTYNQGRTSVPSTLRTVASLPKPVRSSGGGGGGGSKPKKAPSVPIHKFLPGPNTSLVRFNKRKRYR